MSEFETKPDVEEETAPQVDDNDLRNSDILTKYQDAARITNETLQLVMQAAVPGAKVLDLCKLGDANIVEKTSIIYRGKSKGRVVTKGIAFPTCVSVNNTVCHFSPLETDAEVVLADGDVVKIDVGTHVDGYIAVAAHTHVVGTTGAPNTAEPVVGPQSDVILAAYKAAEVALRMLKPGNTNRQVTEAMTRVVNTYGGSMLQGGVMHQLKRFVIDGAKRIALKEEPGQERVPNAAFEEGEVFALDICVSSGDGKAKEGDARTTVHKRAVERTYQLAGQSARKLLSVITQKFPTLPFTLRAVEDERTARTGVRECVSHGLLSAYPVLYEKATDKVAHFKFTVLILPTGAHKIAGLTLPEGYSSEHVLPADLEALLATNPVVSKKKQKKAKAAAESAGAGAADLN